MGSDVVVEYKIGIIFACRVGKENVSFVKYGVMVDGQIMNAVDSHNKVSVSLVRADIIDKIILYKYVLSVGVGS